MRVTTETLSQVTNLLAIVTAPPIETSTIRHIEVLALQPQVLMVVVITSTGGVSKRRFTFPSPVDTGLSTGPRVSQRAPGRSRRSGPGCSTSVCSIRRSPKPEREFVQALAPVFTDLAGDGPGEPVHGRRGPAC